jgi:hypothetical protein
MKIFQVKFLQAPTGDLLQIYKIVLTQIGGIAIKPVFGVNSRSSHHAKLTITFQLAFSLSRI